VVDYCFDLVFRFNNNYLPFIDFLSHLTLHFRFSHLNFRSYHHHSHCCLYQSFLQIFFYLLIIFPIGIPNFFFIHRQNYLFFRENHFQFNYSIIYSHFHNLYYAVLKLTQYFLIIYPILKAINFIHFLINYINLNF
jgi:hypothetical protein